MIKQVINLLGIYLYINIFLLSAAEAGCCCSFFSLSLSLLLGLLRRRLLLYVSCHVARRTRLQKALPSFDSHFYLSFIPEAINKKKKEEYFFFLFLLDIIERERERERPAGYRCRGQYQQRHRDCTIKSLHTIII